ncbi:sugar phosphate isomerase/epimerase [Candidatus Thorarchaeota archaeon]|jgi:sugar phosphate isomerase/epimerase|nr:MAG: sugar phosphate isomerase/epimerase [Candidatus Thorarchaeota archaeon]
MRLPANRAYHVIYDESLIDAVRYAADNEWTSIVPDIGVPSFSPHLIPEEERDLIRDVSHELSIGWGFHAAGDNVSLFSTYPPIRDGILRYLRQTIDLARDVAHDSTNVVVHVGAPPNFRKARDQTENFNETHRDLYATALRETLDFLVRYAASHVKIAVENTGWTSLIREVIEQLLPSGLTICLDIPKLYDSNMEVLEDDWSLIQKHRDCIEVVHIHDIHPTLGSHQVVGEGVIDFEPHLRFLAELKTTPQYVFEVRPRELATESLRTFSSLMEALHVRL